MQLLHLESAIEHLSMLNAWQGYMFSDQVQPLHLQPEYNYAP